MFEIGSLSSRELNRSKEKTFQERVAEKIEQKMTATEENVVKYSL